MKDSRPVRQVFIENVASEWIDAHWCILPFTFKITTCSNQWKHLLLWICNDVVLEYKTTGLISWIMNKSCLWESACAITSFLFKLWQFPSTPLDVHPPWVFPSLILSRLLDRKLSAHLPSFWTTSGPLHHLLPSAPDTSLIHLFVVAVLFYLLRPEIEVHWQITDLIPCSWNVLARAGKSCHQSDDTCSGDNCFQRGRCPATLTLSLHPSHHTHTHTHTYTHRDTLTTSSLNSSSRDTHPLLKKTSCTLFTVSLSRQVCHLPFDIFLFTSMSFFDPSTSISSLSGSLAVTFKLPHPSPSSHISKLHMGALTHAQDFLLL